MKRVKLVDEDVETESLSLCEDAVSANVRVLPAVTGRRAHQPASRRMGDLRELEPDEARAQPTQGSPSCSV